MKVAEYMWDSKNLGYFNALNGNWLTLNDSSKQLTFKYWTLAWLWLYERTGDVTYYNYAKAYTNLLIDKAWKNGFFDSYSTAWSPSTSEKSAAGNGISLWELVNAYAVTGNSTYYLYATRTASWLIGNLWDSTNGCFWEANTLVGVDKYVEGCSDAIIGLMSLYQINGNQTFKPYIDKSVSFITSAWDAQYGGFYSRVSGIGDCTAVKNGCNKYPNECIWTIIALAYYYSIWGSQTAKTYADEGVSYINSTLWDWGSSYRGGLFRSLYRNDTIRDNTKTAWDNCGEPWMIWFASEKMGGSTTYQSLAVKILNWCTSYLHDGAYGGFVTEVNRNGTAITFDTKDAECLSDSIASLSLVSVVSPVPSVELTTLLNLYEDRADLQSAFPSVAVGQYGGLVTWADGVVGGSFVDSGRPSLMPFAYWYVMMGTYSSRGDLQTAFPNAYYSMSTYTSLINWAGGVVGQKWADSSYSTLAPFGYWYTLMSVYNQRGDLQSAFPDAYASPSSYQTLINWAGGVVTKQWSDNSYSTLSPYGYYYTLAMVYISRADLQSAFPNAYSSWPSYVSLVNWAGGVVTQQWSDSSYGTLNTYGYWYDLVMTYNTRPDLQTAFPNVYTSQTAFQNLVNWANGVVTKAWPDSSYNNLSYYASWYEAHYT